MKLTMNESPRRQTKKQNPPSTTKRLQCEVCNTYFATEDAYRAHKKALMGKMGPGCLSKITKLQI